ncbi:hypothetical protein MVEN_00450000 [Mycena venus]|uniref:F-box domain-containing protein n=1 Tax=Mycena venus TaxID=2733690 RepID=A0A8H6YV22_9AGAR|nr:hypothetical protein MVEN_00450000 [Mycena venus]
MLPPEIIDKILGLIHSNSTLRTCSLVSRSWLPASRARLHRSLSISKSDIRRLVNLLKNPENTFTPILHTLELDTDPDDSALNERLPLLFARLYTFAYLETLVLCGAQLYCDFKFPLVPSVVSMELTAVRAHSLPIFTSFLSHFPNLNRLKITRTPIGPGTSFQTDAPYHRLALDKLSIDVSSIGAALAWLASSATAPIVQTLDISSTQHPPTYAIIQRVSAYLRWLGPRLTHFCITLPSFTGPLDFSVSSSLSSLTVHDALCLTPDSSASSASSKWVVHIAPTVPSFLSLFNNTSALTTLTFPISTSPLNCRTGTGAYVDDLARCLSALQLKSLHLKLEGDRSADARDAVRMTFVDRLPPAAARLVVFVDGSGM